MIDRRKLLLAGAGAAGASLLSRPAISQGASSGSWPNKIVKLVCPFPAGGAVDVTARIMANRLSEVWGQQVVVENRPGAGGNIGAEAVARSDPDGYTFFIVSIGHAVNKFLFNSLNYDPVADFSPVTLLLMQPNIMVVPASSPVKSVAEFIDFAKQRQGNVNYASSGIGTSIHLCGEMFKKLTGVQMKPVHYRGSAPALNDLIPGRLDVMFDNISSSLPHTRNGNLRGLAVTTAQRVSAVPELAPIGDTVKGYDVSSWFSFFLPAKTPPEIVAKMNKDSVEALKHEPTKKRLEELGAALVGSTPAQMAAHLKSEMDKWGPIIKEGGIKADG